MYAIMIVEDEELIRQGLTSLVDYEQFGMAVINQAENGREAWEKFQEQPADILLTDINMPQMNGLDLAHLVKEQSPSCHIIFLTGYDDFEFARKAIKLGADDYLLKPFSKDDIEEMLAKVKGKLDQERMKKAQLLLLTTDLKIYEIADQVGFEDMNYFSQRFKQVVGVTPRQYKKGEHE